MGENKGGVPEVLVPDRGCFNADGKPKKAFSKDIARRVARTMTHQKGEVYDAYRCKRCRKKNPQGRYWHVGSRPSWKRRSA